MAADAANVPRLSGWWPWNKQNLRPVKEIHAGAGGPIGLAARGGVSLIDRVAAPRTAVRQIHFTGACGRAVGSLALALKRRGWRVTASDKIQYAPMDRVLAEGGLAIAPKFAARNVPPGTELVVVGGAIGRRNVERVAARRRGIPVMHMARFVGEHLAGRHRRLVVAGTKGKTTTTAMLAWILEHNGCRPDYLVGGLCPHFPLPVRYEGAPVMVLEGDEFPSSREDPTPKFLFYKPDVLVVTNVEFDHAEVYPSVREIQALFVRLAGGLPAAGKLVVSGDCANAAALARGCPAEAETVGWDSGSRFRLTGFKATPRGMRFRFCGQLFHLRQPGRMLALDAALAARAALHAGVGMAESAAALAEFQGVAGRLEPLLDDPFATIVHDESAHPSALRENIAALRLRFPGRRLVVVLQPRYTGGRHNFHEQALPDVLAAADRVVLLRAFDPAPWPAGPFSSHRLAGQLRCRGLAASVLNRSRSLASYCARTHRAGDVWFCSLPAGCEFLTGPLVAAIRALAP